MAEIPTCRRQQPLAVAVRRSRRNKNIRREQKAGREHEEKNGKQKCLRIVGLRIAGCEKGQDEDQIEPAERRYDPIRHGHQERGTDHEGGQRDRQQGKRRGAVKNDELQYAGHE